MRYFQAIMVIVAFAAPPLDFSFAQGVADYPTRPVRVIVPTGPSGASDIQTRMFAQKLSESLKRSFVVENRAGGNGAIGYGLVAKSEPDGYTLLSVTPTLTFGRALNLEFPDPFKAFAPIAIMAKSPFLLLVNPVIPVKSINELIALAKAKPGALDMGVSSGSLNHLAAAYFISTANIKVAIIPYKGLGQAMVDAIAGQIPMFFGNPLSTLLHVKSGRLRALGISSAERSSVLPDLPTISESGLPGYDVTTWQGWAAPAGTPSGIISKLNAELAKATRSPDVAEKLEAGGGRAFYRTSEQFREVIALEVPRWNKVVKNSGIRVQ